MSRTVCEIRDSHDWQVVLDDNSWLPESVACDDCDSRIWLRGIPWRALDDLIAYSPRSDAQAHYSAGVRDALAVLRGREPQGCAA
jgi:hypothetical protein